MYGIIFDVDGVIADTEAVNARASIRMFAEVFGLTGVRRADFAAGLGRGAENYVRAAAKVHNFDMSAQQLKVATQTRQDYFLKMLAENPLPPFPGVREMIDEAGNRNDIKLAIATSSTREKSGAVLTSAQIPVEHMAWITGSDVAHKKPHPELFLKAASALHLVPSDCLVIEDAPNGVEAALAAGCACVAVTNSTSAAYLARAHRIVDSLKDMDAEQLIAIINSRNS
ncbi:MAG: HAD-IA family hydrolase [Chitinivibrionales bacterium]|nr:HAD-IA family hydrolase [Chitinivibrionales bacterium]